MKRRLVLLGAASLACAGICLAQVLPSVDLICSGKAVAIYENVTNTEIIVTIQATDRCAGDESTVILKPKSGTATKRAVPDGATTTFSFAVPPSGSVEFECKGRAGGKCSYVLSMR